MATVADAGGGGAPGSCPFTEGLKIEMPCYVSEHSLLGPLCTVTACTSAVFKSFAKVTGDLVLLLKHILSFCLKRNSE